MRCIKCKSENTILLPRRWEKNTRADAVNPLRKKPRQIKCKSCEHVGAIWHWSKFWRELGKQKVIGTKKTKKEG
ncbi:MAG: hypothetical protein UY48_C0011G0033 [Candidatus Gottesmanbacteria bacterium GW2011_GWB1_49_7]|uniref:Uncharacterized protein n=1 Tax=Candidatus Gottesmanbacteria bacterium GW2011_GWB1_49_7 TaxID=1618448 RepID=A0A0G1W1G5_9BACT|nr:MAG: hypothetical protein UY48_C0011G0033 [Candidatus Gottesmanbacteria bacterium GW2011_GWB1_49_7]